MSFLKNIFSSKEKMPPIDLGLVKTDIHSHLIPGIDDGSQNMDETIEMLKGMSDLGYKKVITTPHIMSDFYKNTPEIILSGLEKVREAIKDHNIDIEIDAAAEYYLDFDFDEKIGKEKLLTFGDNYVLFEVSFISEPPNMTSCIFDLITNNYKPIMAHVERYLYWHRDFEKYHELKSRGVLLQMNINSLSGFYGPGVKKISEKLIEEDLIDFLGTDCHRMGHLELIGQISTNTHLHQLVNKEKLLNKQL